MVALCLLMSEKGIRRAEPAVYDFREELRMPADLSKKMTPETLGTGVYDPSRFEKFSSDDATVVIMYEDTDQTLVVWNLEPGQENAPHVHPTNAHTMAVLSGEGLLLRENGATAPIKAGDCIIVPRNVVHGIRNTGRTRLSYLAVTTNGPEGYVKQTTSGERVAVEH
jgi:mannose-6-phosphate isomerase-like protein (cupin superfamily)